VIVFRVVCPPESGAEAEVGELDVTLGVDENVVGLDVPVNNAVGMGVLQGSGDVMGNVNGISHIEPALVLKNLVGAGAIDELHDQEVKLGLRVLSSLERPNDIGMIQGGAAARLAVETMDEVLIGIQTLVEDLQRNLPAGAGVKSKEDRPHSTFAQLAKNAKRAKHLAIRLVAGGRSRPGWIPGRWRSAWHRPIGVDVGFFHRFFVRCRLVREPDMSSPHRWIYLGSGLEGANLSR